MKPTDALLVSALILAVSGCQDMTPANPPLSHSFALRLVWDGTNEPLPSKQYDRLVLASDRSPETLWVHKKVEIAMADVKSAVAQTPKGMTREWFEAANRQSQQPLFTEEDIQLNLDRPEVLVEFTPAGSAKLAALTKAKIGHRLAIVVDGQVVMAPKIGEAITGGALQITGMFDARSAEDLATKLQPTRHNE